MIETATSSLDVCFSEGSLDVLFSDTERMVLSSRDISVVDLDCPRASVPAADPLIGLVVADRYRIIEAIGRGGMGVVYRVEHVQIGKLLAMKLLRGELTRNPEVVRRFKREALTVSRLQCPNTVQVFDFGVEGGLTYLVMELVHGENLARVLQAQGPMPASRLGKIVIQMCSSLAEAHRKGIVHRDIKPDNVMLLSAEGGAEVVKVLDFGLAKLREAEGLNEITSSGTLLGTPYYMAPEQVRGEEVDQRSDVYAIGALMYRCLTGHHPFSGAPMTVLSKHLNEIPIPPSERAPHLGIPLAMSRLVMRALSKDPGDRFQRVEDLQSLLVDTIRAAGSSSVVGLLDSARLRRLSAPAVAAATHDEVDAYERKLRRKRHGAAGLAALLVSAAAAAACFAPHPAKPSGVESEPNDTAAEATPLPLGQRMTGQLGKRVDAYHGDRDFYALDLPASAPSAGGSFELRVSSLPTMALCVILYKPGFADAVGQYCARIPGRDLVIPSIKLDPGRYLLVVLQDLDSYGGPPPQIQESISDRYTLLINSIAPEPESESAPDDAAPAKPVALGQPKQPG
ncbi:MAG: serine/threonine-protein kinase [Byssovorax sp.]